MNRGFIWEHELNTIPADRGDCGGLMHKIQVKGRSPPLILDESVFPDV